MKNQWVNDQVEIRVDHERDPVPRKTPRTPRKRNVWEIRAHVKKGGKLTAEEAALLLRNPSEAGVDENGMKDEGSNVGSPQKEDTAATEEGKEGNKGSQTNDKHLVKLNNGEIFFVTDVRIIIIIIVKNIY